MRIESSIQAIVVRQSPSLVSREHRRAQSPRRPAMALMVVVVLTMLIALGAYRFSFYMESEYRLTRLHEEQVHAKLAALSGIELAASIAELPAAERSNLGGMYDNRPLFQVSIEAPTNVSTRSESVGSTWQFALVSPAVGNAAGANRKLSSSLDTEQDSNNIRFGFENESAKLHIPTLLEWDRRTPGHARATLLALPGATEQLVDTWLRGLGVAKQRSTATGGSSLLDRLEASGENNNQQSDMDLLKSMWFGGDLNQNYRLDSLEVRLTEQLFTQQQGGARVSPAGPATNRAASNSTDASAPPPAWQRYVTWHSGQRNETQAGQPRINLNETNLQALHQKMIAVWPADWANFVIAMRQYGPATTPANPTAPAGETTPAQSEAFTPDFSKPASYTFKSPLDLIGAVVQIPVPNPQPAPDGKTNVTTKRIRNPFSSDLSEVRNYLGRVLDASTTDPRPFSIGRVDVSEATAEVLAGVPGIDAGLAQQIVQQRTSSAGASTTEPLDTIAWLLNGAGLDLAKLKSIEPYITSRNDVYSVQSVGFRDNLSPVYRCTATIDARQIPAQIRNHQIWHPWDRGFSIDQLNSPSQ